MKTKLDVSTYPKRAADLKEGDMVDLCSCPYLKDDPAAEFEYAEVVEVAQETPTTVIVDYDHRGAAYDNDQLLLVARTGKTFQELTGEDVLIAYNQLYDNEIIVKNYNGTPAQIKEVNDRGIAHWTQMFQNRLDSIKAGDFDNQTSLGKNFVGKVIRAILVAMSIEKTPKNKTELRKVFGL